MAILTEKDAETLRKRFQSLERKIHLIVFTQELECQFCRETRMLMEEIAGLSDNFNLETYNFQIDKSETEKYRIERIPAIVVMADEDVGIRFYGIPSGYEFASLLESIELVAKDVSPLPKDLLQQLEKVDKDVRIQVFVTPT